MNFQMRISWIACGFLVALFPLNLAAADLLLTVSTDKTEYMADEAIKITWNIDNHGTTPVNFDHSIQDGLTNGYRIQRLEPNPQILAEVPTTGLLAGSFRGPEIESLAPGKSFSRTFNLRRTGRFKLVPGSYSIQFYFDASHIPSWFRVEKYVKVTVVKLTSNELRFRIKKESTPSVAVLLSQIEQKAAIKDLAAAVNEEVPLMWDYTSEPYRRRCAAFAAILEYGNRIALPLIEFGLSLRNPEVNDLCCRALLDYDDVTSRDIRRILDRRLDQGNVSREIWGWSPTLLEKDLDIENLPLVLKAMRVLPPDLEESRQRLQRLEYRLREKEAKMRGNGAEK